MMRREGGTFCMACLVPSQGNTDSVIMGTCHVSGGVFRRTACRRPAERPMPCGGGFAYHSRVTRDPGCLLPYPLSGLHSSRMRDSVFQG